MNFQAFRQLFNSFLHRDINTENYSNEILEHLDDLFYEIDGIKFSAFLTKDVVPSVFQKIEDLERQIKSTGTSRSTYKIRKKIKTFLGEYRHFLNYIIDNYSAVLKDSKELKNIRNQELKKDRTLIEIIIDGSSKDSISPFPEYYNEDVINTAIDQLKTIYSELFVIPEKFEFAKHKLIALLNNLKVKISERELELLAVSKKLNEYQKKANSTNKEEYYKQQYDDKTIAQSSLKEYYQECYWAYLELHSNIHQHKNLLSSLFNFLTDEYVFTKSEESLSINEVTVFGDDNFELLDKVYYEFLSFLSPYVSKDDFKEYFIIKSSPPTNKLDLCNGNLNDFGYLMLKMRTFFVDKISTGKYYSLWWSERFTFNLKNKTPKQVSNSISFIKKGTRFPEKKSSTNKIVEILTSSYNSPTISIE